MGIKRANILVFKRKGFVAKVLGSLLKLFEPDWDGWGWHIGVVWEEAYDGWYVLEATALGNKINFYSEDYLSDNARNYTWFEKVPSRAKMAMFLQNHIDKPYDIAIYFWTTIAVIVRHYFNKPIPKLLDNRFSCWELGAEFCSNMGKPLISKYDVIIITDMVKALTEGVE